MVRGLGLSLSPRLQLGVWFCLELGEESKSRAPLGLGLERGCQRKGQGAKRIVLWGHVHLGYGWGCWARAWL